MLAEASPSDAGKYTLVREKIPPLIIFAALCRTGPTLLPPVLEKEPVLFVLPPAPWASINAIRALAMDAVEAANSGHPGTPMALAPAAYVLRSEEHTSELHSPI